MRNKKSVFSLWWPGRWKLKCWILCWLLLRRLDQYIGGYRCLSRHCKRAGDWHFLRLHPSTCVPVLLRPVCNWQWNWHRVRTFNIWRWFPQDDTFKMKTSSFLFSCMAGYINNSLSIASLGDGKAKISPSQMVTSTGINVTSCRFAALYI